MMTPKFASLIILFFIGVFQFLLDYIWSERKEKKYRIIRGILLCLMVVAFFASAATVINDDKNSEDLNRKLKKLQEESTNSADLLKENATKTREISELNKKIAQKSGEIARLNKEISEYISGGDSFCFALFRRLENDPTTAFITIIHRGKYPLYDVTMRIPDLSNYVLSDDNGGRSELSEAEWMDVMMGDLTINLGTLSPNSARTIVRKWRYFTDNKRSYNIFFTARNGGFTQIYRAKLV